MTDRPIIFSGPMVRALLAGRKTQTRRLAKFMEPSGPQFHVHGRGGGWIGPEARVAEVGPDYAPYAKGDRLYVREAFSLIFAGGGHVGGGGEWAYELEYRCDQATREIEFSGSHDDDPYAFLADRQIGDWRPSIHMPRWSSRLTLIVEDVRVERLQAISEEDARAEGVEREPTKLGAWEDYTKLTSGAMSAKESFATLWQSLHGLDSWAANPFVVALTFRVVHGNIDRIAA